MINIISRRFLRPLVSCSILMIGFSANSAVIKYIEKNDSFSKTSTVSTSTGSQNVPIISLFSKIPEFTMQGDAYAYEIGRDFVNPLAPKIIELGTLTTSYGAVTESNDTGKIEQKYGDPQVTDTARAQTSFTGTPIGPQIGVGPVTTSALDGIIGNLGLTLETTQEGSLESISSYAKGVVDDPFYYNGLVGDQTIWLNPGMDAGTRFTYDTGGVASSDMLSVYRGEMNTNAGVVSLFELNIGVGNSAGFSPDIVVDFESNALFGLDDTAVENSILDAFSFDSATSSFFLADNLDLFTLPINIPTFGSMLENPFTVALTSAADTGGGSPFQRVSDFSQRFNYDGSGLAHILANMSSSPNTPLPAPGTLLLLCSGMFWLTARRGRLG